MATKISGILFDIGGVLVTLDGVPSLAKLLGVEASHGAIHQLWMSSPSVVSHETGKMSATEFAAGVVSDLNLPIAADAFLQDFCGWPRALQPGALDLLTDIPATYRVAVLSNTSAVHWEKIAAMGVAASFDVMFLSHEIGCLKPSPEAFQVALVGMALPAEEIVFFDDGIANVDAAKRLGMKAYLVESPAEARRVLEALGVLAKPA